MNEVMKVTSVSKIHLIMLMNNIRNIRRVYCTFNVGLHHTYPGARGYLFSPGLNIPSGEIGVVFGFTFHT